MVGITSFGAYIPLWKLKREAISQGGRGEKSVANFDEDSLTMAVSAAINSVAGMDRSVVDGLFFASTTFPYKEKQGASIVAAASDLRKDILTVDLANTLRGGTSGVKIAADIVKAGSVRNVAVVASDSRLGAPGSIFEQICGDGAGALVVGIDNVAVEILGHLSMYNQIIDVWRADEDKFIRSWEDRFVQSQGYVKTVQNTVLALIKEHNLEPKDFSKAVIYAPDQRRVGEVASRLGFDPKTQLQDPLISVMGNTGTAYPLMLLIAALEEAKAGDMILWASYGDGCDAFILKVNEQIEELRNQRGIRDLLEPKRYIKDYHTYLEWKGLFDRGVDNQIPSDEVSMPALWRDWDEVVRFYGSKCKSCGTIQYPPQRACTKCHVVDDFDKIRLSDQKGSLFTFSIDFVTNPLDKQMVISVVDFDCGGRAVLVMTDRDPKGIRLGMPLEMSFRKLFYNKNEGIHNYFWRCVPARIKTQ
ncbi:MAG: zinc ribbon domain-containing protein [Thermodesulfobacteriota bacterium]|nr:zinc ribbon domain-containing protein [Thermodesulfobacteriota bacterium]